MYVETYSIIIVLLIDLYSIIHILTHFNRNFFLFNIYRIHGFDSIQPIHEWVGFGWVERKNLLNLTQSKP